MQMAQNPTFWNLSSREEEGIRLIKIKESKENLERRRTSIHRTHLLQNQFEF